MTVVRNRERGLRVEDAACERWPLQPVVDNRDEWCDLKAYDEVLEDVGETAVLQEDTSIEVKSCLHEYDGWNGRWWIRQENHEQLLGVGGQYVLAVVDRETGEIQRMALVDARTVDALIDEWWEAGDGGRTAEEYRQIAWTRVFHDLDAPDGGDQG